MSTILSTEEVLKGSWNECLVLLPLFSQPGIVLFAFLVKWVCLLLVGTYLGNHWVSYQRAAFSWCKQICVEGAYNRGLGKTVMFSYPPGHRRPPDVSLSFIDCLRTCECGFDFGNSRPRQKLLQDSWKVMALLYFWEKKKVKVEMERERATVLKGRLKGHFLALSSDSHPSLPFPPTVIPS